MRDRMSEIFWHPVTTASRAPRFPTTWPKTTGSGDENDTRTTAWACARCLLFENLLPVASTAVASNSRRVSDLKVPIDVNGSKRLSPIPSGRKCHITVVKWYQGRKCLITAVKRYQGWKCCITAVKRYQGRKCSITVVKRYQGIVENVTSRTVKWYQGEK